MRWHMAKVAVTKGLLDSLAQHINTKAGTTGAKTIAQMQATVDGIATADANHLRYTYNNPATVSGRGNYVTIVAGDDQLASIRGEESLIVIFRAAGEATCTKSGIGTNMSTLLPIYSINNNCQAVHRLKSDGGITSNSTIQAVNDDTNISVGSGRIYITPEGDLRIYCNTDSYPILAGEIVVDVIW